MSKVIITPEIASKFLDYNISNRPMSQRTVDRYIEEMKNGDWEYNGESIKISKDGNVIDGQHRLKAIVLSGITIETELVDNLDPKVSSKIDVGKKRSLSDTIHIAGYKYHVETAAITRHLWFWFNYGYEYGCRQHSHISNLKGLEFYEKYKRRIDKALEFCVPYKNKHKILPAPLSTLTFTYLILSTIDTREAQEFIDKLIERHYCYTRSPILALHALLKGPDRLIFRGSVNSCYYILDAIFTAWNLFRNKQRVDKMTFKQKLQKVTQPNGYNRKTDANILTPPEDPNPPYSPIPQHESVDQDQQQESNA